MIRKLLGRLLAGSGARAGRPRIVPQSRHGISPNQISSCARRVVSSLQDRGFRAYVVGGAVRDLLLGLQPKDFDVATDATPEEVRSVFRRSRIIGRRFRLVHAMCGDETVEVSTFRAKHVVVESSESATDAHGRVLRDNVFGTQEDDAGRRDFTINALFYDPVSGEIVDYVGGLADLKARRLRMIGNPEARYREDPVRMLRAVRLSAKLGLKIETGTRTPIRKLGPLLKNVPPARVFEEMMKLLLSGHAATCVPRLREEGLHHGLLPMLDVIVEQPLGERFVMLALQRTDERVREGKPVSPGFLFAALLWHEVLSAWKDAEASGLKPIPALFQAMDEVLHDQAESIAIPRRFGTEMKEIWVLQAGLLNRSGRRPYALLANPRFRAGYDFLRLRCESGEVEMEVADWWERFQHADDEARRQMLMPGNGAGRRKRRRRRGGRAQESAPPGAQES
jgi:poly(A) polymerase